MQKESFNLITDPWIQVLNQTGELKEVSLLEVFKNAAKYQRLAGEMQSQDLAILRLLVAILTTVYSRINENDKIYDGLELDERLHLVKVNRAPSYEQLKDTWHGLYKKKHFSNALFQYLKANSDKFDFFGDQPFYQVTKEVYDQVVPANKKVNIKNPKGTVDVKQINRTISESNNSPAIFSPRTSRMKNELNLSQLIRWIITYQSFTGVTDKTKITSKEKFSVSSGWLYGLNPVFAQGENLFQTLMLNLVFLDQYQEEKPVWEFDSSVDYIEFIKNQTESSKLSISFLYTVWSRILHLEWVDNKPIIFTAGLPKLDSTNLFQEPMTTWKHNDKEDDFYPATKHLNDLNKAMWRNFGQYVLTVSESNSQKAVETHEPELIKWLREIKRNEFLATDMSLTLKTVTLVSDGNATSQSPVAEINDNFKIRANVLFDESGKNYWPAIIEDMINMTQQAGKDFWIFANNISKLRGIDGSEFANNLTAEFYDTLNVPFLTWLASLRNDQERRDKVYEWETELKRIALGRAEEVLQNASPRDMIGRENSDQDEVNGLKNIFTIFNRYKLNVLIHING